MNNEGTDITTPKSTVKVIVVGGDPNVTIEGKIIENSGTHSVVGTTGTSGSSGPSPVYAQMKNIKKFYFKGKYPKPR